MMTVDEALMGADDDSFGIESERVLAAEVRRLREQVASDEITIELIDHRLESFRDDNARLREENERLRIENIALREDSDRIDWLADVNNTVGSVVLPRHIVEQNISSLRQAIDAARSAKTLPEPAP
jgi:regulator of replication initiation timing